MGATGSGPAKLPASHGGRGVRAVRGVRAAATPVWEHLETNNYEGVRADLEAGTNVTCDMIEQAVRMDVGMGPPGSTRFTELLLGAPGMRSAGPGGSPCSLRAAVNAAIELNTAAAEDRALDSSAVLEVLLRHDATVGGRAMLERLPELVELALDRGAAQALRALLQYPAVGPSGERVFTLDTEALKEALLRAVSHTHTALVAEILPLLPTNTDLTGALRRAIVYDRGEVAAAILDHADFPPPVLQSEFFNAAGRGSTDVMRSIASATAFDAGAALVAAATANNVAAARFLLEQAPQFSHKALLTAFGKSLKHADGNVVHAMLQYLRAAPVAEFLYIKALGFWVGGKGVIPSEEF
jgi:hypothetical protein